MALHPVGPLPASTYWLRRAGLVLGVLVLVVLAKSCAGGGSSRKAAEVTPTPTPTPRATPSTPPARATASPVHVVLPTCTDTALQVTTSTDAPAYAVGGTPRLTLSVKNGSATACRRDLGSGAVELLVYSGADRVWSSDDCGQGKAVALTTLAAGGSQAVVLTWSGKRSLPGCGGNREQAKPGTYRVVARVGTLRTQGAVFRFTG